MKTLQCPVCGTIYYSAAHPDNLVVPSCPCGGRLVLINEGILKK